MHEVLLNKILANISPSLIKGRDDNPNDGFEWSADAIYLIHLPYGQTFRVLAELLEENSWNDEIRYSIIWYDEIYV